MLQDPGQLQDGAGISQLQLCSSVLPQCWIPLGSVPWMQESSLECDAPPSPGWVRVGCPQNHPCHSEEWSRASLSWENPSGRALAPPSSTCPGCHHTLALAPAGWTGGAPSAPGDVTEGPRCSLQGNSRLGDHQEWGHTRQPLLAFPSMESAVSPEDPLSTPQKWEGKFCGTTSSPRKTPKLGEEWG